MASVEIVLKLTAEEAFRLKELLGNIPQQAGGPTRDIVALLKSWGVEDYTAIAGIFYAVRQLER